MENELKVMIVKNDNGTITTSIETIKDELETFYKIIGCECIDIVERKIGNSYYDIVLDDEGLLLAEPYTSALGFTDNGELLERLVGTLIICGSGDEEGNLTSLDDTDIENIKKQFKFCFTSDDVLLKKLLFYGF